jgi:hypothetical protein
MAVRPTDASSYSDADAPAGTGGDLSLVYQNLYEMSISPEYYFGNEMGMLAV